MKKATVTEPMKESRDKKTLPVDFCTALEITLSSAKFSLHQIVSSQLKTKINRQNIDKFF